MPVYEKKTLYHIHSFSRVMLFLALGLHFYTWSGPSGNRRHGVLEQSPSMWPDGQTLKTCNIRRKGVVNYADNVAAARSCFTSGSKLNK